MVALQIQTKFSISLIAVLLCGPAVSSREAEISSFMSLGSAAAARTFPIHPGQACDLAEGRKWIDSVRRMLPSDWLSILDGVTPRILLQYKRLTVPVALMYAAVNDPDPGVPQTSVLSRELEIHRVQDTNAARDDSETAHMAELCNDFFVALELSLHESAPLLLDKLRTDHPLAYCASMHDGPAAFRVLVDRYKADAIRHTEATQHDDCLLKLRFQP